MEILDKSPYLPKVDEKISVHDIKSEKIAPKIQEIGSIINRASISKK